MLETLQQETKEYIEMKKLISNLSEKELKELISYALNLLHECTN